MVPIAVPPLREHREDIPALADHFLRQASAQNDRRCKGIEQAAVSLLMQYDWPGNVRELRNSIERLVILSSAESITEEDVRACLPAVKSVPTSYRKGISLREMVASAERDIILRALEENAGQVSKTAAELQVERSHLYKKMKSLGIDHRGDS